MKNAEKTRFLMIGGLALLSSFLSGCTSKEAKCLASDFSPALCNFYTAEGTDQALLDNQVVFVGDSLFDYGEGYGAIPKDLIARSGKTYADLSVSGQRTSYINDVEIPKISTLGDVKTVIVNGGANDILAACGANVETGDNVDRITDTCEAALDSMETGVTNMLNSLAAIASIDHVIWVGPQYFPVDMVARIVIDEAAVRIQSTCTGNLNYKCSFVDNSANWTQEDAAAYLMKDKQHVKKEGAALMGEEIWQRLIAVGAHR